MHVRSWIATAFAGCLALALPLAAQTPPHPLAGKLLDVRTGTLTSLADPAALTKLFACGAITLLGEVHDNPDHHRMRADLIAANQNRAAAACPIGGFVFEHLSVDQQPGLDEFYAFAAKVKRLPVAADVFSRVGWEKSGWPAADLFRPLFDAVLATRRPLVPGHPDRALTRRVAKEGIAALPAERADSLGLTKPLPPQLQDDLLGELEASHCGLMPKQAFINMAVAQRLRDAGMAEAARRTATPPAGAVVLTGNGHVRRDRGVPYYLASLDRPVVAAAFLEIEADKIAAADYVARDSAGQPLYDFIAFAPRATREDPCEQMRKHMKK